MSRLPLVALALLASASVAACSSASAPGWTYAPAPSLTPAPSASGSAAPSASAPGSASPSAGASGSPSAAPSGGPGAIVLTVAAPNGAATTGFDPKELDGPANTPFTVVFDNQDTTTSPHNWVLKDATGAKVAIGDTAFFSGPATKEYQVPALAPGDYPFVCEVHPAGMTGTLTIK